MEVVSLDGFEVVTWSWLDNVYVLLLHVVMNIVYQCFRLHEIRPCIHPRVITAPWNDNVILPEVIWQVNRHIYERYRTFLCIKISQLRVGHKRVISFCRDSLTIDIEELTTWLASITMYDASENLIFITKICWWWLPDEVHSHLIRLDQVVLEILINLCDELCVIAKLRQYATVCRRVPRCLHVPCNIW